MESFDKVAQSYASYNFLQKQVAQSLFATCAAHFMPMRRCIDIGCGDGAIWNCIDAALRCKQSCVQSREWHFAKGLREFVGFDNSLQLLKRHPTASTIQLIKGDFNQSFAQYFKEKGRLFDVAFASSSLQWAKNFKNTIQDIAKIARVLGAAIFTSDSLKELHDFLGMKSPLLDSKSLRLSLESSFYGKYFQKTYTLSFDDLHSLLVYIKRSGIRGDISLNGAQIYKLRRFKGRSLRFKVLFFVGKRLH